MPKIKTFAKVGDPKALEVKLAPQEQVVFDAIPKGKTGIERGALVAILDGLAADGTLKTGQAPSSILGYYTKHLVDSKLITVTVVEVEAPKKEKPAKETPKAA
jgi:hypothetical protein